MYYSKHYSMGSALLDIESQSSSKQQFWLLLSDVQIF